jgi:hypothetical protein
MKYGRLNIIVGGLVIFLGTIGGFALGFTMDPYFEKGFYAVPHARALLSSSHGHSLLLALYNIVIGSFIDKLALTDKWKKRCSLFTVLSFIMPIGLVWGGLPFGEETFPPVLLIGSLCLLASAAIMIKGVISTTSSK